MNMDLNLLPTVAKFQLERIRLIKKINGVVMIVVAVWILIGVVILAGWLLAKWNLSNQAEKNKKVQSELSTLAGNVAINQELRHKAKLVGEILGGRFEYYSAFVGLDSIFTSNVTIQDYKLDKKSRFIVNGLATGSQGIDEVEKKVKSINNGEVEKFSSARIASLSKTGNQWRFNIELAIK